MPLRVADFCLFVAYFSLYLVSSSGSKVMKTLYVEMV